MSDQLAGQVIRTNLDEENGTGNNQPQTRQVLNPVTQRVIERAIQEVLAEYVKNSKHFTADSLHTLRVNITNLVKDRLGADEIGTIDIGLDLSALNEIPFSFNLTVPDSKKMVHFIDVPIEYQEHTGGDVDTKSVEEFQKSVNLGLSK